MKSLLRLACAFGLIALHQAAFGFNGHTVTEGPLTLSIAEVPVVRAFEAPQTCTVTLTNSRDAPLPVTLTIGGLTEDCAVVGDATQQLTVPAPGTSTATFQFSCTRTALTALYPVHVTARFAENGASRDAHAVQIFQTDFSPAERARVVPPVPASVIRIPAAGAFSLTDRVSPAIAWSYLGGPLVREPAGWTGSDAISAATFLRAPVTRGGISRAALQLHPPYRPRAGTVFAEYRLRLPPATPIRLQFFNAIRDSAPQEGASDGVTFRVWVDEQKLFERHTDAKTWTAGEADLSAFAGREILLRLESHPGPKANTSCDSSYWGDPIIAVGAPPKVATDVERRALATRARALLEAATSSHGDGSTALAYDLEGGCRAVVVLGPNGLADGVIGFGSREQQVLFAGLHMAVNDHVVGAWPSAAIVEGVEVTTEASGRTRIAHRILANDQHVEITATVWPEGPGLRIKVECPERITGLGLNPADQRAPRVYYGHGYCIVEPQAFRAVAGGHNLSTSHVGFDFASGVSLLTASDTPPDHLQVDPERQLYQLHTHPDATLTFVPGLRGAFDCAVRYRPLSEKHAAPGVTRKAGRFVFDLWGGKYADDAAKLARCFDYGLHNSLVLMHTWQRWGYDYRLPDIFPPLPSLGTLAELQELGRLCTTRGALWGLHDNYIDFYPDATGFTYDDITFTEDGKPRRAWLNESRDAQSYQFRPDRIRPFLDRNLALVVPALRPTASFVDVFASHPTFDFFDRAGNLHSKRETQRAWGEAFAAIRDACGGTAPTVSEAGGDYLIGWLDGADAQFMQLGTSPERFHNVVPCRDWERVPWFDAVNHTRFSPHGVGYSDRYQGGRSREEHGIESDDYLSAELLTAHALMIDLPALGRGAVRKHWLAQDFVASLAGDEIRSVEFAGGDIHRVITTWNSSARVCVNRGETDWDIDGHTLPQFGYWAKHGPIESSVERLGSAIVEQSRAPGKFYWNSRVFAPAAPLAVTPRAERLEYLGGRQFKLIVDWSVQRAVPKHLMAFYHFSRPTPGRRAATEFTGGGEPKSRTTEWQGHATTGADWTITIPDGMPAGDYDVLVGLYDPKNRGARERLQGDEDSRRRYRIGKLVVAGTKSGDITGVRLVQPEKPFEPSARWFANEGTVDFGAAKTDGAFRCEVAPHCLIVTPLPDGPDFELQVRLPAVLGRNLAVQSVEAIDASGVAHGAARYTETADGVAFTAAGNIFAYRINFR